MQQASCLEGAPLLWIWPLYLHVNQKSDDECYSQFCLQKIFSHQGSQTIYGGSSIISNTSSIRKIMEKMGFQIFFFSFLKTVDGIAMQTRYFLIRLLLRSSLICMCSCFWFFFFFFFFFFFVLFCFFFKHFYHNQV